MSNKQSNQKPLTLVTVLLSALHLSTLAHAEIQATDSKDSLFDLSIEDLMGIKVTVASLFEESELDAASSVSLITSDQWEKTDARRVADVLETVPSVVSYPTWGGADAIAIRGYATELSVRGIANTLDGIPLNSFTYATSLYDKPVINLNHLDRIEMIRGPGSTLYGTDAFHGVVSHQLKHSDKNETRITGNIGQSRYQDASFFTSKVFDSFSFSGGFGVTKQGEQDLRYKYTSPYDGLEYGAERDYEYKDLSGYAVVKTGNEQVGKFKFTAYVDDYESSEMPGIGTQFFARLPAIFDLDSTSLAMDKDHSGQESDFWLTALDYSYQITRDLTFDSKVYHWNTNQEWQFDNSRYPTSLTTLSAITLPCRDNLNAGVNPNPIYCPHELKQSSDEHRSGVQAYLKGIESAWSTQWVVGIGRDRLKVDNSKFIRIADDGTQLLSQSNLYEGAKRTVDYALFQGKTGVMDQQLQFVYGVRVDDYDDLESHTSPRLGFIYNVTGNFTSKLLYGHAFRAPTALERLGSVQGVVANENIEPEEIDTVEWVNVFYDKDYSAEITLFGSKWKEGIVLVPFSGTTNQYVNTGENKSYGLEFSGRKQFERVILNGSGSYVKSRNTDTDNDYLAFPEWIFNLQAHYLLPEHDMEFVLKQRVMLDYAEGDYLGDTRPEDSDDYYRTDFSIIHKLNPIANDGEQELFLHVRNIFDQENTIPSLYNAEGGLDDYGLGVNVGLRWTF